ncbi:MAG: lactate racemase domain-containing protein [Anaerocolumna sp.]
MIATGCHRGTKKEELVEKFGVNIVEQEKIVIHNCDAEDLSYLGVLPSGGELYINRTAAEADLLIAEEFIEPHFLRDIPEAERVYYPESLQEKQYTRTIAQNL